MVVLGFAWKLYRPTRLDNTGAPTYLYAWRNRTTGPVMISILTAVFAGSRVAIKKIISVAMVRDTIPEGMMAVSVSGMKNGYVVNPPNTDPSKPQHELRESRGGTRAPRPWGADTIDLVMLDSEDY